MRSSAMLPSCTLAAMFITAPARADLPIQIFNLPGLGGTGQATVVSAIDGSEIFVNGFNGLQFQTANFVDPTDPRLFNFGRMGTTGGGIGGPPPARVTSQSSVQTTAALLEGMNITGSVFVFGGTSTILPDQRGGVSGSATASLNFFVTAPVYAQWSGGAGTSLLFNGSPLTLNPVSIILLVPGSYEASATASGFAVAPPGELSGFSASNGFGLLISNNVPAPSAAAVLALAGVLASRRRRS